MTSQSLLENKGEMEGRENANTKRKEVETHKEGERMEKCSGAPWACDASLFKKPRAESIKNTLHRHKINSAVIFSFCF